MKQHLTQRLIEQLPVPAKRTWYTGDQCRGLTLAQTPTVTKPLYAVRKHRGKTQRHYLGRFPELSLASAKAQAGQIALHFKRLR